MDPTYQNVALRYFVLITIPPPKVVAPWFWTHFGRFWGRDGKHGGVPSYFLGVFFCAISAHFFRDIVCLVKGGDTRFWVQKMCKNVQKMVKNARKWRFLRSPLWSLVTFAQAPSAKFTVDMFPGLFADFSSGFFDIFRVFSIYASYEGFWGGLNTVLRKASLVWYTFFAKKMTRKMSFFGNNKIIDFFMFFCVFLGASRG